MCATNFIKTSGKIQVHKTPHSDSSLNSLLKVTSVIGNEDFFFLTDHKKVLYQSTVSKETEKDLVE